MPPKHHSRLFARLLRFVLPLLFLSIILTSLVLSSTNYNYFRTSVNHDYRNIVKASAGEIHFYFAGAQRSVERLAYILAAIKPDPVQEEAALTAFNFRSPDFMSLSIFSPDGTLVRERGSRTVDLDGVEEATFPKALKGHTAISGVRHTREHLPFIDIMVPVLHLGEVRQVVVGRLNLKSVWEVLEGIHIGETGEISIMDIEGRLIGHREMDRVLRDTSMVRKEVLAQLEASPDTPISWEEESEGDVYYCLGVVIPELNWVVVLSQAESEIFSPLHSNVFWATIVTTVICFAAIILAWKWVRRFLIPIEHLHAQVQKIGEGHLDQQVTVSSRDEIGELGIAFNQMTASLNDYIHREIEAARELTHARNLATLGVTTSKVKHEVANLLASLKLALKFLRTESMNTASQITVGQLERQADRLDAFVKDLLKFAKKPEIEPILVPLDAVIEDALFFHRDEAKSRGIAIDFTWPPGVPSVLADIRLMHQLFQNLVKNALEAMGSMDGGRIAIEGRIEGRSLIVTVDDNGPGIPPEALERIFDPFFTTKEKGTGLGLAICRTFAEAHRGKLECESEPGVGTTFRLVLPLL